MRLHPFKSSCVSALVAGCVFIATTAQAGEEFSPIGLDEIELGGEMGRRIGLTVSQNLKKIDVDKDFLKSFREKKPASARYIGLGKLIDSLVHFAVHTGDPEILALKKHVVTETIRSQEPDGYIGMFPAGQRVWEVWDFHEASYIVLGLTADYEHFKEENSFEAARRLAGYFMRRAAADPDRVPGGPAHSLWLTTTGFDSALLALGRQTGDKSYLDFCRKVRKVPQWDTKIFTGRFGKVDAHAYAYMSKCLEQVRIYREMPDPELLRQSRRVYDFLTRGDGMVITGTCGYSECWHDSQIGSTMLGETCATVHLIEFLDTLLQLDGDSIYGDLMERAIYNALFAAQSPDGRQIRYYTPTDGPRVYWPRDTYCCPCNFRRGIAELPSRVFYRAGGGVAVNLYTAATAKMELSGGLKLTLNQETDYPNSGKVALRVTPSRAVAFPLRLRIPCWASTATIKVNGQPIEGEIKSGSFALIERGWEPGDLVELEMPMSWQFVRGRKAQAGRVAVMRGPLVFCLGRECNAKLAGMPLGPITIHPETIEGPLADDSIRPDGLACRIKAVPPGGHLGDNPGLQLTLREFAHPEGEATFFIVPNPLAPGIGDDELLGVTQTQDTRDRR